MCIGWLKNGIVLNKYHNLQFFAQHNIVRNRIIITRANIQLSFLRVKGRLKSLEKFWQYSQILKVWTKAQDMGGPCTGWGLQHLVCRSLPTDILILS